MIITKEKLTFKFNGSRIIDLTHKDGITAHLLVVEACPEKGFNFGYILYLPNDIDDDTSVFVRCANTAQSKPGLEEGMEDIFRKSINFDYSVDLVARNHKLPILKPLIPRFYNETESFYSHALPSEVYFTNNELFKDLDIQQINMFIDAKTRLESLGIIVDERFIIEGFSSAGVFANRITVLHPDRVKLCIAGGFNGKLTLPLKEYNGKKLIYPVGVSNIPYYNDAYFEEFKLVKQFYYMGSEDNNNDSLATTEINGKLYPKYKNYCTKEELDLFFGIFGKIPIDRFKKSLEIYNELGVDADFKIYDGYEHTDEPAIKDIEEKLSAILNKEDKIL